MKNLFYYRLTLILGQLALLLVNQQLVFWPEVGINLWLLCGLYLLVIVVVAFKDFSHHQSRYMLLLDLLLWSAYFYYLGGVSNPLIWCLLIPSVLSALSQSVSYTWIMTLLANLVYLLLWALGFNELNQHSHHNNDTALQMHITGMWLGFIAVSVLLTWVTTQLMHRIHQKNQTLLALEQHRQADENIIKMATLATSLAHELGTPLNSIKLLVDELKLSLDSTQQIEDLRLLDSQVERCKTALSELTAVTDRSRMDELQVISDRAFIEQLIAAVKPAECVMTVNICHQQEVLIAVDTLLHLACVNVLNNSLSAGAKNIIISSELQSKHLQLSISDDGLGVNQQSNGLGIGLKLSQRIIESNGGKITLAADEHGAKTTVIMPVRVS